MVAKHARVCKIVNSSLRHHLQELWDVGDEVEACLNSTVDTTIMCVYIATCTVDSAQCSGCVIYGSDVMAVTQSSVLVFSTL